MVMNMVQGKLISDNSMISQNKKLYANESNNVIMIQLSNVLLKNRLPMTIVYLFVHCVVNLTSDKR